MQFSSHVLTGGMRQLCNLSLRRFWSGIQPRLCMKWWCMDPQKLCIELWPFLRSLNGWITTKSSTRFSVLTSIITSWKKSSSGPPRSVSWWLGNWTTFSKIHFDGPKKREELQLLFQTVHISVEAVGGQWNQKLYANQWIHLLRIIYYLLVAIFSANSISVMLRNQS